MKNSHFRTNYIIHSQSKTLGSAINKLIQEAMDASKLAYAPYSKFKVGAALLLHDEIIILGSNQENASYPAGTCAERVALHNKAMQCPEKKILAIAIYAPSKTNQLPAAPCGICRQVLYEQEVNQQQAIKVFLKGNNSKIIELHSIKDLLPFGFSGDALH